MNMIKIIISRYFSKIDNFPDGEINERSFSPPPPPPRLLFIGSEVILDALKHKIVLFLIRSPKLNLILKYVWSGIERKSGLQSPNRVSLYTEPKLHRKIRNIKYSCQWIQFWQSCLVLYPETPVYIKSEQQFLSSYSMRNKIGGLVQDCSNFSGLAMELLESCINPHPVIRGLWGPGMHKNCHYLKISLNLVLGFHVILRNVAWYNSWMFLCSVAELKNNYFEFNENCT